MLQLNLIEMSPHSIHRRWYDDPCFHRYWKHYAQTYSWYKHHLEQTTRCLQQSSGKQYTHTVKENCTEWPESSPELTDVEQLGLEMQVTEEMIDFFQQSEIHRQKLKKLRAEQLARSRTEAEVASKLIGASWAHQAARLPEQVEENGLGLNRRSNEMLYLYGKAGALISGMETATQLTYDRFCDIHQPSYWPVIPLNL